MAPRPVPVQELSDAISAFINEECQESESERQGCVPQNGRYTKAYLEVRFGMATFSAETHALCGEIGILRGKIDPQLIRFLQLAEYPVIDIARVGLLSWLFNLGFRREEQVFVFFLILNLIKRVLFLMAFYFELPPPPRNSHTLFERVLRQFLRLLKLPYFILLGIIRWYLWLLKLPYFILLGIKWLIFSCFE